MKTTRIVAAALCCCALLGSLTVACGPMTPAPQPTTVTADIVTLGGGVKCDGTSLTGTDGPRVGSVTATRNPTSVKFDFTFTSAVASTQLRPELFAAGSACSGAGVSDDLGRLRTPITTDSNGAGTASQQVLLPLTTYTGTKVGSNPGGDDVVLVFDGGVATGGDKYVARLRIPGGSAANCPGGLPARPTGLDGTVVLNESVADISDADLRTYLKDAKWAIVYDQGSVAEDMAAAKRIADACVVPVRYAGWSAGSVGPGRFIDGKVPDASYFMCGSGTTPATLNGGQFSWINPNDARVADGVRRELAEIQSAGYRGVYVEWGKGLFIDGAATAGGPKVADLASTCPGPGGVADGQNGFTMAQGVVELMRGARNTGLATMLLCCSRARLEAPTSSTVSAAVRLRASGMADLLISQQGNSLASTGSLQAGTDPAKFSLATEYSFNEKQTDRTSAALICGDDTDISFKWARAKLWNQPVIVNWGRQPGTCSGFYPNFVNVDLGDPLPVNAAGPTTGACAGTGACTYARRYTKGSVYVNNSPAGDSTTSLQDYPPGSSPLVFVTDPNYSTCPGGAAGVYPAKLPPSGPAFPLDYGCLNASTRAPNGSGATVLVYRTGTEGPWLTGAAATQAVTVDAKGLLRIARRDVSPDGSQPTGWRAGVVDETTTYGFTPSVVRSRKSGRTLVAATTQAGVLRVFASVEQRASTAARWEKPLELGGGFQNAPALIETAAGIYVVSRTTDSGLKVFAVEDPSSPGSSQQPLRLIQTCGAATAAGNVAGPPTVSYNPLNGSLRIVALDPNGKVRGYFGAAPTAKSPACSALIGYDLRPGESGFAGSTTAFTLPGTANTLVATVQSGKVVLLRNVNGTSTWDRFDTNVASTGTPDLAFQFTDGSTRIWLATRVGDGASAQLVVTSLDFTGEQLGPVLSTSALGTPGQGALNPSISYSPLGGKSGKGRFVVTSGTSTDQKLSVWQSDDLFATTPNPQYAADNRGNDLTGFAAYAPRGLEDTFATGASDATEPELAPPSGTITGLLPSADLRQWSGPAVDQGDLPTCVAYALANLVAWYVNHDRKTSKGMELQPNFLYWTNRNGNGSALTGFGSSKLSEMFSTLTTDGITPVVDDVNDGRFAAPDAATRAAAAAYKVTGARKLFLQYPDNLDLISWQNTGWLQAKAVVQQRLGQDHPVVLMLRYRWGQKLLGDFGQLVDYPSFDPGYASDRNHALLALGYDAEGVFVQNSWGPQWTYVDGAGRSYPGIGKISWEVFRKDVFQAWTIDGLAQPDGPAPAPFTSDELRNGGQRGAVVSGCSATYAASAPAALSVTAGSGCTAASIVAEGQSPSGVIVRSPDPVSDDPSPGGKLATLPSGSSLTGGWLKANGSRWWWIGPPQGGGSGPPPGG